MGKKKKDSISLKQVEKLAMYGLTEDEIANVLGISVRSINYYKKDDPEFLHALKKGKDVADAKVIESLYRRALGYSHEDVQFFCFQGEVIPARYVKHYPPDVTACIFWLKNRQADRWRAKQEEKSMEKFEKEEIEIVPQNGKFKKTASRLDRFLVN